MYSLDQVIYFLEQGQQTEDWNIRDATIAYLKGYREVLPEYAQMKLDAVKDDPLTLDVLKGMEGKPVWLECMDDEQQTGWALIVKNPGRPTFGKPKIFTFVRDGGRFYLTITGYGKRWQAYRKERK